MFGNYRIVVAEIPCSRRFPEIERELLAIAGRTPTGEQRIKCEWGGTAKRPFGNQQNCKFGLRSELVVSGWRFEGDPIAKRKRDRMPTEWYDADISTAPDHVALFSDGRPRVFAPIEVLVDHPLPNWFFTDWLSPRQVGGGPGYGRGYWRKIWRCFDESRDFHPWYGYRDPDSVDLDVIRAYWHEKVNDLETMGVHIDDPIEGDVAEIQNAWMDRAAVHLAEEQLGERTEETVRFLEKHLDSDRQTNPGFVKPLVDLGVLHAKR